MTQNDEKPYWWPVLLNDEWREKVRKGYPDETSGMSDDELDEKYADGWKYVDLWDHLGDARHSYEKLADHMLEQSTRIRDLEAQLKARDDAAFNEGIEAASRQWCKGVTHFIPLSALE